MIRGINDRPNPDLPKLPHRDQAHGVPGGFPRVARLALALLSVIEGANTLALLGPSFVACRDLGLPIRTRTRQHKSRFVRRRWRWWRGIERAAVAPEKWYRWNPLESPFGIAGMGVLKVAWNAVFRLVLMPASMLALGSAFGEVAAK
jgi:hypothetical protein